MNMVQPRELGAPPAGGVASTGAAGAAGAAATGATPGTAPGTGTGTESLSSSSIVHPRVVGRGGGGEAAAGVDRPSAAGSASVGSSMIIVQPRVLGLTSPVGPA